MNVIAFIAAVLAVWRVTHLLVEEHGPWDVMARLRRGAAAVGLERLVNCFYCASVWIAVPFALLLTTRWRELVLVVPALSGGAILLERATQKEDAPPVWIEEQEKEKSP
jgi:hypothetical protein